MAVLLVQIKDDLPEEVIDRIYRQIVKLYGVSGVMPVPNTDPDVVYAEISAFHVSLTDDQARRLGLS